jgi:membrane fusion protein (multidrug efflux system)
MRIFRAITIIAALAGTPMPAPAGPPDDEVFQAISAPSQEVEPSFAQSGQVAEVLVKEGDVLKVGQPLVRLDDEAERIRLAQLKADAEDLTRIRAAEAQLELKKKDREKLEYLLARKAVAPIDVDRAKVDVTVAELSLELVRFEQARSRRKYEEAKVRLDRMTLRSPIDGRVEAVHVRPGEAVDAQQKIVRIVNTDLLWIHVWVPVGRARTLSQGQPATVTFADGGGSDAGQAAERVAGKIVHIAAVADAASGTRRLRVEVSNPSGRPAGEHVKVSFPAAQRGKGAAERSDKPTLTPDAKEDE